MKSNEWYTPSRYIEAAREVMGGIDLDPASCELANKTVKATRFYTKEDNGLLHSWSGRVWLNPPYRMYKDSKGLFKSSTANFTTKLLEEHQKGHIEQAVLLIASQTHSQWFAPMWNFPICFTDHRVKFHGEKYNSKTALMHMWGTLFIYLGPNEQKFIDTFSQFGRIAKAIDVPKPKPYNLDLWQEAAS